MAEVDPFDIFDGFEEDKGDDKYDKPSYTGSRGGGLYKKSLKALAKEKERNAVKKEYPSLTDELADELIEKRKRNKGMLEWSEDLQRAVMAEEYKKAHPEMSDEEIQERVDYQMNGVDVEDYDEKSAPEVQEEEPSVDVPEMETEVVDLPEENENEKEIVINRNEDTVNPDATIAGDNGPDFKPEDMTDPEIVENQYEDFPDRVTDEEVADTETAVTEDANKKEEQKEGEEKPSSMSDEDALKEAQELAQDDLLGFKISGANWEKMSEKQKAEAIKAFKDANKKEDHSTNIDKSETNNYSSYERYPTGLKVTEDALSEVNTVAGGIKDAAHKIGQQGTNSGSITNEVARAVPHYDYRSLFR